MGLEWSDTCLKLVSLKRDGQNYRLWRLDKITIPPNQLGETTKLLAQWVSTNFPKGEQVEAVLTLPESLIFLKELELPKVKDKGLSEAILWEISSVAPFTPSEAVIQWKKIVEGEKLTRLTVVVAKRETVQDLLSVIQEAGVRLLAIEPSSTAFSRLFQEKLGKTTLLVIVEEKETNSIILKNGVPVFSTSTPVPLVRMRTKRRRLSTEVASSLAANAKKVIAYWETKEEGKIQQVIITGEGIRYYGLASAINSLTHIPTGFAKVQKFPKIGIPASQKTTLERSLIPLGAAARLIWEDHQEINLLPEKERKILGREESQRKIAEKISLLAKMTFVFLVVSLLFLGGLKVLNSSFQKEIAQTNLFVNNHPAQKFVPQIQAANKILSQVDWLMDEQKDTGVRLQQIAQLTPANIRFKTLSFTGGQNEEWKITGVGDREAILAFHERLKASSGASSVLMPYSNLQKEKEGDFKITIIW